MRISSLMDEEFSGPFFSNLPKTDFVNCILAVLGRDESEPIPNLGSNKNYLKLKTNLSTKIKKCEKHIEKIPNSLEKAKEALHWYIKIKGLDQYLYIPALSYLDTDIRILFDEELNFWKKDLQNLSNKKNPLNNLIFWASRDFEDDLDDIAHYRVYEQLKPVGFEAVFNQVENRFATALLESFDGKSGPPQNFKYDSDYVK